MGFIILYCFAYFVIAILHYLMTRRFLRHSGMYSETDRINNILFSFIWPVSVIPICLFFGINWDSDEEAKW